MDAARETLSGRLRPSAQDASQAAASPRSQELGPSAAHTAQPAPTSPTSVDAVQRSSPRAATLGSSCLGVSRRGSPCLQGARSTASAVIQSFTGAESQRRPGGAVRRGQFRRHLRHSLEVISSGPHGSGEVDDRGWSRRRRVEPRPQRELPPPRWVVSRSSEQGGEHHVRRASVASAACAGSPNPGRLGSSDPGCTTTRSPRHSTPGGASFGWRVDHPLRRDGLART